MRTWFEIEVLSVRVFATMTWTIILEFVGVFLFLFLTSLLLDPLHPLTSLSSSLHSLLTPSSWFYDLLLIFCLTWWCSLHAKNYLLSPTVLDSWASTLLLATTSSKLMSLLTHTLICGLMTWCYVKLHSGPFSNLTKLCQEDGESLCLNENHMFLVLSGVLTGPVLWSRYHFCNANLISFPAIIQSKSSHLRLRLPGLVWSSSTQSLLLLRWYYVAYFLIGQLLLQPVTGLLGLPVPGLLTISLPSYLNLMLFLECWAVTFLLHLTSATLTTTMALYLTEPLHLELPSLLDALNTDQSLLHHLSLSSWSRLAATNSPSRAAVFTLSQPGGHPSNWNTVSSLCLKQIDAMTKKLSDLTSPKPAAAPAPSKEVADTAAPGMRRLAPDMGLAPAKETKGVSLVTPPTQILKEATDHAWKEMKKKPLLSVFFSSPPDSSLLLALSHSQPVIWSVEILSHLVSASLTEDKYGVVQKQLPVILTSFLNLETSLDRTRTPSLTSLRRTSSQFPELQLRRELRAAVKSAIYRIVVTFGEYILAVPLPKDLQQKIKNYQTFMEA